MNSVPFGFAYGIWVRNQLGFLLCAVGLVTMALFYPLLFALSKAPSTLVASTIPLVFIFTYVLNSTIFAQETGSLASSYPRHMLVLPVKAWSLVLWPMLFGSVIAVSLLVVTVKIVYRSSGLEIPLGLPTLAVVVIVSWFQAIAWIPLKSAPGSFCDRSGSHAGAGRFLCGSSSVEIRTRKLWSSPFWPHTSWRRMRWLLQR